MTPAPTIEERKEIIIENLLDGEKTLAELGERFGISRERVSQIFYQATGKNRGFLRKKREEIWEEEKEKELEKIKFHCASCDKPVNHKEGKYKHKYCVECHYLSQYEKRDMTITYECANCDTEFHPYRNSVGEKKVGHFCSRDCYYTRKKD